MRKTQNVPLRAEKHSKYAPEKTHEVCKDITMSKVRKRTHFGCNIKSQMKLQGKFDSTMDSRLRGNDNSVRNVRVPHSANGGRWDK